MTKAVCIACGQMKFGVLLPCNSCPMDRAYAFAFSDHFVEAPDLEEISKEILTTQTLPVLSPEVEAQFVKAYGRLGGS